MRGDRVRSRVDFGFLESIQDPEPACQQAAEDQADAGDGVEEVRVGHILVQAMLHLGAEDGDQRGQREEEGDQQVEPMGLHRHLMGVGRLLFGLVGDREFQGVADVGYEQFGGPLDVVRFVAEVNQVPVGGESLRASCRVACRFRAVRWIGPIASRMV